MLNYIFFCFINFCGSCKKSFRKLKLINTIYFKKYFKKIISFGEFSAENVIVLLLTYTDTITNFIAIRSL